MESTIRKFIEFSFLGFPRFFDVSTKYYNVSCMYCNTQSLWKNAKTLLWQKIYDGLLIPVVATYVSKPPACRQLHGSENVRSAHRFQISLCFPQMAVVSVHLLLKIAKDFLVNRIIRFPIDSQLINLNPFIASLFIFSLKCLLIPHLLDIILRLRVMLYMYRYYQLVKR